MTSITSSELPTARISALEPSSSRIKTKCWRVTNIPNIWDEDHLLNTLEKIQSLKNLRECVEQLTLHLDFDGSTKTALLNLKEHPEFFRGQFDSKDIRVVGGGIAGNDLYLWVDCHFYDFTPLNTPEGEILADVIAVSGLGGHAFGSWKHRETGRMWLMDFLPLDIKGIRIMLYGYDTNLERATGGFSVLDHSRMFTERILHVRNQENAKNRPIIFIGHSFGGLLILKTLYRARGNQIEKHIFDSTHAIILFGTPHTGFDVSKLMEMVREKRGKQDAMLNLLQYLEPESDFMAVYRDEMSHLLPEIPRIVSFYEKEDTPTLKRLRTGEYKRLGEAEKMVNENSALLGLPNELRIPVQLDHSMLVKFANQPGSPYHCVVNHLREILKNVNSVNPQKPFDHSHINVNQTPITHPFHHLQPIILPDIYKIPFELGHQWLQNLRFTGRKNLLATLASTLFTKDPPGKQVAVIYGTGGVGKTELALEYVYRNHNSYTSVFWVNATSLETTNQSFGSIVQRIVEHYITNWTTPPDYLQIAQLLGMPNGLDSNGKVRADITTLNTTVKRWFCKGENKGWLLVFDNVDDLESFTISSFIPSCSHGTIIMTSRRPECVDHGAGAGLLVEQMEEADGIELLLKCANISTPISSEESEMAADIAKRLGYLPLAIHQAGTYISDRRIPLERYLRLFKTSFDTIFREPPIRSQLWRYRDDTIFTTWEISFRAVEEENKKAAELMLLCSFLSNNDIRYDMLCYGMGDGADEDTLDECLRSLVSYSLISQKGLDKSFYIHPLVHRWARGRVCPEKHGEMADSALMLVCKSIGFNSEQLNAIPEFGKKIIGHVDTISVHAHNRLDGILYESASPESASRTAPEQLCGLIARLAWAYDDNNRYHDAEDLESKVLSVHERLFGTEHEETLTSMYYLAMTYHNQGRLEEAEGLHLKALHGREKLLGTDHKDTLKCMNNLANTYNDQGRLEEAEGLHLKALAGMEKLLGTDNEGTLTSMNNLASTYLDQGRLKEAEGLYLKALAGREKLLGTDHKDTLLSMNDLANTYCNQGRLEEAEGLYLKTLAGREKLLGTDHKDTLMIMNTLANAYYYRGRLEEAEGLHLKDLAGMEKLLGTDHEDTLRCMNNLANTYHGQGRLEEAEGLFLKALAGCEKLFGTDHKHTLISMNCLANIYHDQGRLKEAGGLHLKALHRREKLFGADDEGTLTSMSNLASTYLDQGRLKEAKGLYLKALAGREKLLGTDHKDTLLSMNDLASTYYNQRYLEEAEGLYLKALAGSEKLLGTDHKDTLTTMYNLANTYRGQGRLEEAEGLFLKTLAGSEKLLGTDHKHTLNTMNSLANTYLDQGRLKEAEGLYLKALAGMEKLLGTDHKHTLKSMNNLANTYRRQGRLDEAENLKTSFYSRRASADH